MEYKRLTEKDWHKEKFYPKADNERVIRKRLWDLENKIEQGTLIELPRMFKAIDRTGWIVEFIDESGYVCRNHFFHEERAIKRLKELQK